MMAVSEEMVKEEEQRLEKRRKCHYLNIECMRLPRPDEGSMTCNNCLLAGLLRGIAKQIGWQVSWLLTEE